MRTIVFSLMLVACSKSAPEPAAEARTTQPATEAGAQDHFPDTADGRAFADALTRLEITDLSPTGASEFIYRTMAFQRDGTWSADAELRVGGEEAPCRESGTWRVVDLTDADTATMVWTVTETNCATRNEGDETRLLLDISPDGTYQISFR